MRPVGPAASPGDANPCRGSIECGPTSAPGTALRVGDLVRPGDSGLDAGADSRWLTGFTGTSALAIVGPEARIFITDFRYVERAEREVGDAFEHVSAESRLLPTLGPAGMRSDWLMTLALRWMGNLVTEEDRDRAARVWRWAGRRSMSIRPSRWRPTTRCAAHRTSC